MRLALLQDKSDPWKLSGFVQPPIARRGGSSHPQPDYTRRACGF